MYEIDDNHQGIGALIDSNLLIQVDSVLSGDRRINPCFLYDLGVLTEAICLSDSYTWYFQDQIQNDRPPGLTNHQSAVEKVLADRYKTDEGIAGPLSDALIASGSIKAYSGREIATIAEQKNLEFDYNQFLLDLIYGTPAFNYIEVDEYFDEYINLQTLASDLFLNSPHFNFVRLLRRTNITVLEQDNAGDKEVLQPFSELSGLTPILSDQEALEEGRLTGPSFSDLRLKGFIYDLIDAQEQWSNSVYRVAECFGLEDVHLPLLGRTMQIQRNYGQAVNYITKIIDDAKMKVESVENSFNYRVGYSLLPVPAFARILLSKCKSREDIPLRLIELRDRYSSLRDTIIRYTKRVSEAQSVGDLLRIDHELQTAWQNLLKKEEMDLSSRLTYRVWDIVKTGPKMLIEFLDSLRRKDELEYPIFRVRGLYDLWADLKLMPPKKRFRSLVEEVFAEPIQEKDYMAVHGYCESLEPWTSDRLKDHSCSDFTEGRNHIAS